jgi:hypothetical protein
MELSLLPFISMIVFSAAALFFAAQIISIELKFSKAVVVSVVSTAAGTLSGGIGIMLSLFAYFGLLKLFTDASIIKIIVLSVISLMITVAAFKLLIAPLILSAF